MGAAKSKAKGLKGSGAAQRLTALGIEGTVKGSQSLGIDGITASDVTAVFQAQPRQPYSSPRATPFVGAHRGGAHTAERSLTARADTARGGKARSTAEIDSLVSFVEGGNGDAAPLPLSLPPLPC